MQSRPVPDLDRPALQPGRREPAKHHEVLHDSIAGFPRDRVPSPDHDDDGEDRDGDADKSDEYQEFVEAAG